MQIRDDSEKQDVEQISNFNESEGIMPKESCDETNSYYYNESSRVPSSAEPTPEQPKIKKSPIKKKNGVTPTKVVVKKDYLSSDNQSNGKCKSFSKYAI